jgi:hypothetical protein
MRESKCFGRTCNTAKLILSSRCYCGNTIAANRTPVAGILGQCNMKCKGNANQFCGGPSALSLYKKCTGSICQNVPFSDVLAGSSDMVQSAVLAVSSSGVSSKPISSTKSVSPSAPLSIPVKIVSSAQGTSLKTSTRPSTSTKAASPVVSHAVKSSSVPVSMVYVTVTKMGSSCGYKKRDVR